MEMHQIRYFLALCEELNFTRAAQTSNVSQPSLTRAIKMLEEELGGPLFHRERANTHLTELGRTVRPYLEQVYREADKARQQAQDFIRLKQTPLRLGLMCTIAPNQMLEFVAAVQLRYPGIALQIVDAAAAELEQRLIAGELEVAIYALPETPPNNGLHYLQLYREQFMIVMQPSHRLAAGTCVQVRELHGERYLSRVNCEYGMAADRVFDELKVDWPTVYESERDDWILAMAAAGLGLAFMPRLCVNHPGVVARPLVAPEFWREVSMVTVRGRPHSPALGALVTEAMHVRWADQPALAVQQARAHQGESVDDPADGDRSAE
ncbi:MAG TPA: LysR family transcriptional regulator [Xanthobacteraceae bacterium]|nr:LysR family transcriptional regulator [Xanthobacteraceae bacterium]